MDNLQTSKKYFIPMQVTPKIIEEFGINAKEVKWTKIGNKSVRVIMVQATEEQYYAYMYNGSFVKTTKKYLSVS